MGSLCVGCLWLFLYIIVACELAGRNGTENQMHIQEYRSNRKCFASSHDATSFMSVYEKIYIGVCLRRLALGCAYDIPIERQLPLVAAAEFTYVSLATREIRLARLLRHACSARRDDRAANLLTVFILTNRFRDEPHYGNATSVPLPVPTADTRELIHYALSGLKAIFRTGYRYAKAGVVLNELTPASCIQAHLFDETDRARSGRLTATMDRLNAAMGAGTLHYAAAGFNPSWKTKFLRRSPRFTTRWEEIAVAKTG
jgi:hypothetical protein